MNGEEKTDLPNRLELITLFHLQILFDIPDTLNNEYSKIFYDSSYRTLASDDTAYKD